MRITSSQSAELERLLREAKNLGDLAAACHLLARALGFEFFLLAARFPQAVDAPVQVVISGLPRAWDEIYDHRRWLLSDPMFARAMISTAPFCSDDIDWDATPQFRAMRVESRAHHLDHALVVPLHGPLFEAGLMSLARAEPLAADAGEKNALMGAAQLHATRLYARLAQMTAATYLQGMQGAGELSLREQHALSLAALGHSAKVIAAMLGITPRTVAYFLTRAAEKIGADTLREAICKAAMRGQLRLVEYPSQLRLSTAFVKHPPDPKFSIREAAVARYLLAAANDTHGAGVLAAEADPGWMQADPAVMSAGEIDTQMEHGG